MVGIDFGAALTIEQRLARLEQKALLQSLLTTRGDIIRRGASAPERLALGGSGSVLSSDGTDAVWNARFGGRMYLQSSFVFASGGAWRHVGAGGAYWIEENDTSPGSNVVEVGANPRMYCPYSGYYSGTMVIYVAAAGVNLSMCACITTANGAPSVSALVAAAYLDQGAGFWTGQTLVCTFDHQYLAAGTYLYPNAAWIYGGAPGNHTIQGSAATGADLTFFDLRYEGPT